MTLHAMYEIFTGGAEIAMQVILTCMPISTLYILVLFIGIVIMRISDM